MTVGRVGGILIRWSVGTSVGRGIFADFFAVFWLNGGIICFSWNLVAWLVVQREMFVLPTTHVGSFGSSGYIGINRLTSI